MSLPPAPDGFAWTTESWGAALRCVPLAAIAPHLFTTRQLSLASPSDTDRLAAAVGARRVAMARQVHGRTVVVMRHGDVVTRPPEGGPYEGSPYEGSPDAAPEADAFVSDSADVAVAIRVADCVPLLMADRARGVVAAVHAGWRGTAARAAGAALEALEREFGTRPADVVAAIGPSIGPCCYQVDARVRDTFLAATPDAAAWLSDDGPGHWRLDLWRANADALEAVGVPAEAIHTARYCTADHLDTCFSYRREGERTGRLVAAIRLKTSPGS